MRTSHLKLIERLGMMPIYESTSLDDEIVGAIDV